MTNDPTGVRELSMFDNCALWAWVEIAAETGQWPPDSRLTQLRANELYERELAKHGAERGADNA